MTKTANIVVEALRAAKRDARERIRRTGAARTNGGSDAGPGSEHSVAVGAVQFGPVPEGSAELAVALEAARSPEERASVWHAYLEVRPEELQAETAQAAQVVNTGSNADVVEFLNRYAPDQASAEAARLNDDLPERVTQNV